MNDKTGGPAFPLQDASAWQFHGMTLRDYFAAKAMSSYLQSTSSPREAMNVFAEAAYLMADAMIEARNK